jgi:hypothetical protein
MAEDAQDPNRKIAGKVTLSQHHLPALKAGDYELRVTHQVRTLSGSGNRGRQADETFENSVKFAVRGERFRLPVDDLHSVFPPANARGEFANCLPHVVFCRRTLPWERSPWKRDVPSGLVEEDIPTWLALLLFDADDTIAFPPFDLQPKTVTVRDFFPGESLRHGKSYFDSVAPGVAAESVLEFGESLTDPCTAIDVPLELFRAIAPSIEDLKMLAHSRTVSMENQELTPSLQAPGDEVLSPEDDFSIVFGNRLPKKGTRCTVHLVSLEGLEDHLPGGSLGSTPGQLGDFIRLASLQSWSYMTDEQDKSEAHFVQLLKGLKRDSEDNALRLAPKKRDTSDPPDTDNSRADTEVRQALEMGYVALNHDLRGGGNTVSWYRGPLLPYAKQGRIVAGPITSADAVTRYNPDTGIFDVSYAAAWQLGRLLALQNKSYSIALYQWKRRHEKQLAARIEQSIFREQFASLYATAANTAAARPMEGVLDLLAQLEPVAGASNGSHSK